MKIRPARVEDAPAIARTQVQSWRETYTGLLPADFLTRMTGDERRERAAQGWARAVADQHQALLVADDLGEVVGFVAGGPTRDFRGYGGELYALYLRRSAQGSGTGRALVRELVCRLAVLGHTNLLLWVLDGNPTRGFYAHLGGVMVGEKAQDWSGTTLNEVAYGWPDLRTLM